MPFDKALIIDVVIALVAALVMSFAATPVIKAFAQKVGAMDIPDDDRRVHDHPIPRLGGLAIFIAFILSVVLFADISKQVSGILLGAILVVAIGAIDDVISLKAWVKFIFQIIAAVIAVMHDVVIQVIMNPNVFSSVDTLNLGPFAIPVTIIWIVAITNSVNLIDGLDGLAVGVSTISSVMMLVIALLVADANIAVVLASLAGACIGFMPYNLNPAKIFMGDTGALLLGYVLSTVSIIGLFKFYAVVSFAVPFLVLAVPLFDTAFAFFRRLLKGKNPMKPDRGHFHHRLIDMGLTQKQAVAILYSISMLLGLAAVVMTTSGELRALILIICGFFAAIFAGMLIKGKLNGNGNGSGKTSGESEDDKDA